MSIERFKRAKQLQAEINEFMKECNAIDDGVKIELFTRYDGNSFRFKEDEVAKFILMIDMEKAPDASQEWNDFMEGVN